MPTPKAVRPAKKPPRWLSTREQRAWLRAAQKSRGLRDAAPIRLLRHTGLRVEEACALTADDYEVRDRGGAPTVRQGKGRKQRVIPLNSEARQAIAELESTDDPRSPHRLKGRRGPLTPRGVQDLMAKIARKAGRPPITPPDLRHTCGHELAVAGVSIREIADLMGHESLETTRRYFQPGQEDLAAAVQRLAGSED
jgi:integrase/recombinase XerC